MKIIKYSKHYHLEAKSLLNICYKEETSSQFLDEGNTVLGFIDEKLIGLAGFGRSALHDRIVNEYICVDVDHLRSGLGTRLHQTLLHLFPVDQSDFAIDISCFEDEGAEENFILNLGFKKYLDCYLCTFDLDQVVVEESLDDILPLQNIASLKGEVKSFYIKRYNEEHEDYLPVTENEEVWDDYYCNGNNDELSAVIFKDNKIEGCSFFYSGIFEDKNIICINGYATGRNAQEEAKNLKSIYSFQVNKLRETDYKRVYIEVDSTERVAELILKWIPEKSRKIFRRYQLSIPTN